MYIKVIASQTLDIFGTRCIVTMALYCRPIICETYRLISRKSRNFYTPPVFNPPQGQPCRNFPKMFDIRKTRMIGGEEILTKCYAVFIEYRNVADRRTNRQTDRRTDEITFADAREK